MSDHVERFLGHEQRFAHPPDSNTIFPMEMPDLPPMEGLLDDWLGGLMNGLQLVPNSPGIRHHYTPRFVLKNFSRSKNKVFELDKTTGQCQEVALDDAASTDDLYSVRSVDGQHVVADLVAGPSA